MNQYNVMFLFIIFEKLKVVAEVNVEDSMMIFSLSRYKRIILL